MVQFSLQAGLTLRSGQRTLELVRELPDGEYQLEDCVTRRPLVITRADLLKRVWEGKYQVVLSAGATDQQITPKPHRALDIDLSSLSDADKSVIEYRLTYVKALEKGHIRRGERRRVEAIVRSVAVRTNDARRPSASTVMTWARAYQLSGNSPLALLSGNRRRVAARRLHPSMEKLVVRLLREVYFTRERHTIAHALDRIRVAAKELVARKLLTAEDATVSRATLARRVQETDLYQRIAAREGVARARMVCRTTFGGGGASYPLERVEVDHTVLNWVVICERTGLPLGRPVLTVMLDAYSGYLLGFYISFYGPGLTSVSGVIRNAVMLKDDLVKGLNLEHRWLASGLGDELVLDNGLEFHAKSFKLMSWDLGSNLMYCRVRTPWLKPHVERFFGTLNTLTLMSGRVHKRVANVLNLDPAEDAAISFSDLVKGLVMFVTDVHPFQINERKLARPYDLFIEGVERCPPAHYPHSWDQLRLTSGMSKMLTVNAGGVELRGLSYGSGELLPMRKRHGETVRTLVKWDPDDLSCIYVQDPRDQSWVVSPSRWPEYTTGLSWNQHLLIRKFARAELKLKDSQETLLASRMRLHDHWLGATSRKNRADALTAARFSGVTSARILGSDLTPDLPRVARGVVADAELAEAVAVEPPEFETFEMA